MDVRILPAANERILEIWDYTERNWGEEQADYYVRGLVDAVGQIQKNRHLWKPVLDEAMIGIFFFRYEHHFVFFREISIGALGVISILHETMDIPSRLKEDTERGEDV